MLYFGIGWTTSGSNFSENITENHVYFNGIPGTILSSTASSMVVITPNLVSDSVKITVSVQGAFIFGEYVNLYSLTAAVVEYGHLINSQTYIALI